MKKVKYLAPIALAAFLAACGADTTDQAKDTAKEADVVAVETTETATGPYTVVDDRGQEITFEAVPETIISLQPSNTEILFSLGVGEKIVGATDYDTYPEAANDIERVSDSFTINAERIIDLNPDVVIAYTIGDEAQITQLEEAGVKVFVIASAATFDDVYGDIEQIGDVVGEADIADQVVEDIQAQITAVQEKTATLETPKTAYFEVSPAPDIWSAGAETFQHEMLTAANVENLYADQQGWFSVAEEDIITRNPKLILTTANYVEKPIAEIKARTGWNTITAIQTGEIYLLDGEVLTRPATRIGDAVELVAQTVYPELFN